MDDKESEHPATEEKANDRQAKMVVTECDHDQGDTNANNIDEEDDQNRIIDFSMKSQNPQLKRAKGPSDEPISISSANHAADHKMIEAPEPDEATTILSPLAPEPVKEPPPEELVPKEARPSEPAPGPPKEPTSADSSSTSSQVGDTAEKLDFTVLYKKNRYQFSLPATTTVSELRIKIKDLTNLPEIMQKIMHKGTTFKVPEETLWNVGIRKGSKLMVVGSTFDEALGTAVPQDLIKKCQSLESGDKKSHTKEPLCKQTLHKRVLEKYKKPEDIMPAYKPTSTVYLSSQEPLKGLLNRFGAHIRMTFKLELDEVWISSKQSTTKLKMTTITDIVSEPIEGERDLYYIVGLRMGPETIWIYWVPAQYISAIRSAILGR